MKFKSEKARGWITRRIESGIDRIRSKDVLSLIEDVESEAQKEIDNWKTAKEEAERREKIAVNVITSKRKEMERMKEKAGRAFCEQCLNMGADCDRSPIDYPGDYCEYLSNFLSKL